METTLRAPIKMRMIHTQDPSSLALHITQILKYPAWIYSINGVLDSYVR